MRYATICVFFALIIHIDGATADSDFRPIPIPLDQWNYEKREARVGTLHETVNTDKAATVVAVPGHYWEDALRHSVYLTLVRDKIDQLIAKGVVVSPDAKPDQHASKEVDDHDLWDKIKKAPFDRIHDNDYAFYGDVTIMAKGRLMEENGGFRFTEDERSKEECKDEKCMKGVKAFWSVKRVRQRDEEISSGKYHYELTFSVNSQPAKKQRKPFETPVRTFTVRENPTDIIMANPEEQRHQTPLLQTSRPQRAIWFHKNIVPSSRPSQPRHHHSSSLDRIFSSFFSDDVSHVERPPRYKPNPYAPPMYSQYSKLGYVGPSREQQQNRILQHPYIPNMHKYQRPPLQAPPLQMQHHYIDIDAVANQHHIPTLDHRHISPSNIIKTTRPAVLPTPPVPGLNATVKNSTNFYTDDNFNDTQNTTLQPEMPPVYKTFNKPRPPPVKNIHFPERIRPPVYNAPPGVFLTMDKKPFKPMPPLKYMQGSKPSRRPIDFRPSPQFSDGQFSDPDTTVESAFRPILVNFTEKDDSERNKDEVTQDIKETNKHLRKKPPKKQEIIKTQRLTTSAPDIITVYNDLEEDNDTMQWANILGAFTKTTPIEFHTDKEEKAVESTTQSMTPNNSSVKNKKNKITDSPKETTTSTTTPISKKRTRPPHKFAKPEKVKKHKRITTTTAEPDKVQKKKPVDLTPQASSAASDGNKSWQPKNKTATTTSTTSTTSTSTTTHKPPSTTTITTTITPPASTIQTDTITRSEEYKLKNRFRQSTLMIKGTSVKHDRWNVNASGEKKASVTTSKYPPRRKGSNFQGYSSTTPKYSEEFTRGYQPEYSKRTESSNVNNTHFRPQSTQPTYEETADHYINNESTSGYSPSEEEDSEGSRDDIEVINNDEHDSEDHSEFIFDLTSRNPNEKSNEINEDDLIVTEQSIVATSYSVSKNRTKCMKKKHHHLAPTQSSVSVDELLTTTTMATSTKSSSSIDILDDLLGSLTYDDSRAKPKENKPKELDEEESENHEKYLQIDEDFEDFFDSLGDRHRDSDEKEDYEDDEKEPSFDDGVSPFDNDDVNEPRKSSDKDYDEYHERSYSLLELMAME